MAEYVKLALSVRASEMTDYVRPYLHPAQLISELTPDEVKSAVVDALTTGTTLSLANFTTTTTVILHNTDATNYVEAEWYYSRGSQAAAGGGWNIDGAGNPDTISDVGLAGTLVTNGSEVGGYVNISASENSGENDGTYLIQTTNTNTITVGIGESLTTNTDDEAALLTFLRRNKDRIAPSSYLVLGPVYPSLNITLTANTATCSVRAYAFGT